VIKNGQINENNFFFYGQRVDLCLQLNIKKVYTESISISLKLNGKQTTCVEIKRVRRTRYCGVSMAHRSTSVLSVRKYSVDFQIDIFQNDRTKMDKDLEMKIMAGLIVEKRNGQNDSQIFDTHKKLS